MYQLWYVFHTENGWVNSLAFKNEAVHLLWVLESRLGRHVLSKLAVASDGDLNLISQHREPFRMYDYAIQHVSYRCSRCMDTRKCQNGLPCCHFFQ
jgi:hypothetical protein